MKENREKRLHERDQKLRDQRAKKDAHFKARQIVQKEEQLKMAKQKREEMEIQKEMSRIKKEMELDRQMKEEKKIQWVSLFMPSVGLLY